MIVDAAKHFSDKYFIRGIPLDALLIIKFNGRSDERFG